MSMQTIEAGAFVVCLDDAKPADPEERFRQFLFGDGWNRWYDKILQIVICDNGVPATVCQHATLMVFLPNLCMNLCKTLSTVQFRNMNALVNQRWTSRSSDLSLLPDSISLTSHVAIDDYVLRFSQRFQTDILQYSFANVEIANSATTSSLCINVRPNRVHSWLYSLPVADSLATAPQLLRLSLALSLPSISGGGGFSGS